MLTLFDKAPLPKVARDAAALLPQGARVLVAVSGGPDSQTLLDHLALLRPTLKLQALWAVGIDHQLRAGAALELEHARALCDVHNVAFYVLKVDVEAADNVLAAARKARYAALRALARKLGASHIAVGHSATDQVETLVINLCRGATLRGAGAIRAEHRGLVRPLLGITRGAIEAWASARGLPYATDPSNRDARRARAQLREHVLPALAQLNPAFAEHIGAFCADAQEADAFFARRTRKHLRRLLQPDAAASTGSLDVAGLLRLAPLWQRRVLAAWLAHVGAAPTRKALAATADMLVRQSLTPHQTLSVQGATLCFAQGRLARIATPARRDAAQTPERREARRITALAATTLRVPSRQPLARLGELVASSCELASDAATRTWLVAFVAAAAQLPQSRAQAVAFDANRLHFGLTLRPWQQGDKIHPFGLKGRIKVGDLFTNLKVPRALRLGWPLLMCGDEVLWVVGLQRSAHAPVTAKTRRIVTLKVEARSADTQDGCQAPNRPGLF